MVARLTTVSLRKHQHDDKKKKKKIMQYHLRVAKYVLQLSVFPANVSLHSSCIALAKHLHKSVDLPRRKYCDELKY